MEAKAIARQMVEEMFLEANQKFLESVGQDNSLLKLGDLHIGKKLVK